MVQSELTTQLTFLQEQVGSLCSFALTTRSLLAAFRRISPPYFTTCHPLPRGGVSSLSPVKGRASCEYTIFLRCLRAISPSASPPTSYTLVSRTDL